MPGTVRKIVIVGGGAAGWLTACALAAEHGGAGGVDVTLVESPDLPIIGVGEGTWPSMRATLQKIGLPEDELICHCEASFKQGTCFSGWSGAGRDRYYHPFSPPVEYTHLNLAAYWLEQPGRDSFADFVTAQTAVIERGLAPKQLGTPPYAFAVNYAYHFNAGRFAERLHGHGVDKLGVRFVSANVTGVRAAPNGDIAGLELDTGATLEGDLFVDCSGQRAMLLSGHYGVGFRSVSDVLFNDRAIAVQAPYADAAAPIASVTRATALDAGWVWDIGLPTRRGIGYVYSGAHTSDDKAMAALRAYIGEAAAADLSFRTIAFSPGHRERFWVNNCVAIGLSAGFVEPLEASALALVEQSAWMLAEQLPADRELMGIVAARFNRKLSWHWSRIVEFLKLHYVLSQRTDSDYWRDCRDEASCPDALRDKLMLWQQQPPWHDDAPRVDELFPSASYQYVLYGMGFRPRYSPGNRGSLRNNRARADEALHAKVQKADKMVALLPANRALIEGIEARYAAGGAGD